MWPKATFGICKKVLQNGLTVCVCVCACVCGGVRVFVCVCQGGTPDGCKLGSSEEDGCVCVHARVCVMGGGGDIVNVCAML